MSKSNSQSPPPSVPEPQSNRFGADAPIELRKLPTPSLMLAANCNPPNHGSTSPILHRPSSISSVDSGYATASRSRQSADTLEPSLSTYPTAPAPSTAMTAGRSATYPAQPEMRQACIPCRRKKVGCDLRTPGNVEDPPCQRCRHENLRCFFSSSENIPNNPNPQELPSIRDLACPHCSLVFLRDDDLRAHLRTQCAEKHYVCPTCQARFRRLNDLDRHQRIHTGERPHTCNICGRKFGRATTLTRHRQGPDGCAGRRADLGRRRPGSATQSPSPAPAPSSVVVPPTYT